MFELLRGLPQELMVFIIAALPVIELRGAIPYAIGVLKMEPLTALVWSVLGNIVPPIAILYLLGPLQRLLEERLPWISRWFNWLYNRSAKRGELIEKYGPWGLLLFVSIPAPGTGAWTGCILAFLLGIPPVKALAVVTAGIIIAGIIVTMAVTGGLLVFKHLF
ncbi:hypothetical protein N752_10060 [Desulforamulus aquiferis]|nr:small multi-drug export protein [Desulforamulus aquiferis]RYD05308.1 hypothetical protein N752_10060 [Desulforamulus aquiferis]